MIVLSQVLDWLDVGITSQVVEPVPGAVAKSLNGVSSLPAHAAENHHVATETSRSTRSR